MTTQSIQSHFMLTDFFLQEEKQKRHKMQTILPPITPNKVMLAETEEKKSNRLSGLFKSKKPKFKLPKALKDRDKAGKTHYMVARIEKRVIEKGFDPLVSDYFMKAFKGARNLYEPTRDLFREVGLPLLKMADILTGILPYSCITSLSDQAQTTTLGQAYYKDGVRVYDEDGKNPKEAPTGCKKKKSISKMWRLVHRCKEMDLLDIIPMTDSVTGAELPAVIRLKDSFYYIYGESPETLLNARNKRLGWLKSSRQVYVPADEPVETTIEKIAEGWLDNIKVSREAHRKKIRLVNKIGSLESHDLWQYGQRLVNAMTSQHERNNISVPQYRYRVKQAIDDVWRQIRGLERQSKMLI